MRYTTLPLVGLSLLLLIGCKPNPHPSHPDYSVKKPKVRYTPSKQSLKTMVKALKGKPYVWAEEGPNYFDCSGYTYYMYGSMGIEIPRVARDQAKSGELVDPSQLQYGDLIFFDTSKNLNGKIGHVGMYMGDGWFTHASTTKYEIVYSNLNTSTYYKKRMRVCRRYLPMGSDTSVTSLQTWESKPIPVPVVKKHPSRPLVALSKPSTPTQRAGAFYVQIGSFVGEPSRALRYKIKRNGYRYKTLAFRKGDGTKISKLLIGPYMNRTVAQNALGSIRTTLEPSAFIAEIR